MSAAISTWIRKSGDFLFGFDFFISYAHADGMQYPQTLANLLQSKGFRVFLDSRVYVPGDDLHSATRRRIKMSKYLVIILRPGALESRWVLIELQRCLAANRRPIAINVNESLEQARDDNDVRLLLKDKIFITETLGQIDDEPTAATIDSIGRSFDATRQDVIRMRAVTAADLTLIAVAAAAAWQYLEARKREYEAQEQTALQYAANAERQLFQNPQESLLLAAQGLAASTADTAVEASVNALQGALEVIRKRQEIQQDDYWGSNLFQSYIAGAWFEADLSARYDKGGELLLLSTERGRSGRNQPGDAYLLNTTTLSMKALDIGPAWGSRKQGPGVIGTFHVRRNVKRVSVPFVCSAHKNEYGTLEIGEGDAEARIVANDDGGRHWRKTGGNLKARFGRVRLEPGARVDFEVESGQHGLTFLDKDQVLDVLDFGDSSRNFGIQSDIPSRRKPKRRLEFVGFGETGNKIYLARQYNIEVYSADGAFQKEFSAGGGCTKYPISLVTGVLDDQLIIYGDTDGGVYTLDFETGQCNHVQRNPGRILIKFDQSPSGKHAAMVFKDRTAAIWKITKEKPGANMMSLSNEAITSTWFNPLIDNQLLTAGEDGLVALWEVQDDALRQSRVYQHPGEAIGFAMFSADGARILAVDASHNVFIWNTATGEVLRTIKNRSINGASAGEVDAQAG